MRLLVICTILVILLAPTIFASPCSSEWKPPRLYGVRLGMKVRQIKRRFPNLKFSSTDKLKVRDAFDYLTGNDYRKYNVPSIVFEIEMLFLKARLVRYRICYYDSDNWKDMEEFVSRMSEGLKLIELNSLEYRIPQGHKCNDIEVTFWEDSSKSITFLDKIAEPILDERITESYRNAK